MLEHVVRFVITLLIPTAEEADVAWMSRDPSCRAIHRRTGQLLDQPGNSLVFTHGTLNFVSAEMTGNRLALFFQRRAGVRTAAGKG